MHITKHSRTAIFGVGGTAKDGLCLRAQHCALTAPLFAHELEVQFTMGRASCGPTIGPKTPAFRELTRGNHDRPNHWLRIDADDCRRAASICTHGVDLMIDMNKKYKTRDGRDVLLYNVNAGGPRPIHGAIRQFEYWSSMAWLPNGAALPDEQCGGDLIEVKPERWHPIYRRDDGSYYMDRACWTRKEDAMYASSIAHGNPIDAWKSPE